MNATDTWVTKLPVVGDRMDRRPVVAVVKLHGRSCHKLRHPATSDLEVTQRAKITALVATYFLGVQNIMWWQVRQFEKGNPVLWVIPQALPDSEASRQSGLKVSA